MLRQNLIPDLISELSIDTNVFAAIESNLNAFNIFEAIGVTKREIHHSAFLSFLLNPAGQHGLNDLFLKEFLKLCSSSAWQIANLDL